MINIVQPVDFHWRMRRFATHLTLRSPFATAASVLATDMELCFSFDNIGCDTNVLYRDRLFYASELSLKPLPRSPCRSPRNPSQTKGYKKDSGVKIEDIEKLFAEVGKAIYVKICKVSGRKLSKWPAFLVVLGVIFLECLFTC